MHDDLSKLSVMVIDGGSYVALARRLGREFGKVYYHNPAWLKPFPTLNEQYIGKGFPEIEVVESAEPYRDSIDLWYFPDTFSGTTQVALAQAGKRVWGSRTLQELELDRSVLKETLADVGLPVNPYESVHGLTALREYLQEHDDRYVKMDGRFRGHGETFRVRTYTEAKPKLDELAYELGPVAEIIDFMIESPLKRKVEVGTDTYCIDGKYPALISCGCEVKDRGYVMQMRPVSEIPPALWRVNEKLAPLFAKGKFRGAFSTEVRLGTDGKPFLIDPCMRWGSPPNELLQELWLNLGEISYAGAGGELVDPVCAAPYGAQLVLTSPWAEHHWLAVNYPSQYERFVKLRNACRIDGTTYVIPQTPGIAEVGSVIGYGDTLEEAIAMCREVADSISGLDLHAPYDAFDAAAEELAKSAAMGVEVLA